MRATMDEKDSSFTGLEWACVVAFASVSAIAYCLLLIVYVGAIAYAIYRWW